MEPQGFTKSMIEQLFASGNAPTILARHVISRMDTYGRLAAPFRGQRYDSYREPPRTSIQRLFADRNLEKRIGDYLESAFGTRLTVNRYGANEITLHAGTVATPEAQEPPSKEYTEEIWSLPQWNEQGDGMKAFLGIVLELMTASYPIVLIDEPEAFLHPPQAKLLGRLLVELSNADTQVVIATHSTDIIDGMTSAMNSANDLSIVRVTRAGTGNHVSQIEPGSVRKIYDDPLVKYYHILDGMFASGTILCEADSDCTYYQAVLDTVDRLKNGATVQSVMPHFTHCSGKNRLPKAVEALRSVSVPVACITDFDMLRDPTDFEALVNACGGDLGKLMPWRNTIASSIDQKTQKRSRISAKAEIDAIFGDPVKQGELTTSEATKISNAIAKSSGWREAKKTGSSGLSGEAATAFERLDAALRKLGIFLVFVGELERFHKTIPADNKAVWLRNVLDGELYKKSAEAREFVCDAVQYVAG